MSCGVDIRRCVIFWQFNCKVMAEWPWRYRSRSKVIAHDTFSHAGDYLCQIWNESTQKCTCCRADTARCAIFLQFYCKFIVDWPWRYRPRSKVIIHETPSYASNNFLPNMERIHLELYMVWSGYDKMCHILAVLLQSHGWMIPNIYVKAKGYFTQHILSC